MVHSRRISRNTREKYMLLLQGDFLSLKYHKLETLSPGLFTNKLKNRCELQLALKGAPFSDESLMIRGENF